ncbi:MAG: hypothetical protein OEY94_08055 [Alphaproteobacteria bacterium]|nr:hypothetical protein [Alphaproteobacteria bacterium]
MSLTISQMAEFGNLTKSRDFDSGPKSYNSFNPDKELDGSDLMTPSALMDESSFKPQENLYSDHASNNADALFIDDNPNETVFDVLYENEEGVDIKPAVKDTNSLKIDVNKVETAAEIKNDKANNAFDDTEEKMDKLATDWKDHQCVAQEYLEGACDNLADQIGLTEKGISKENVVKQIMPQGDTGKGSAALQAAPAVNAAEFVSSVNEQRKDLSREQKRALIEDMVKTAQSKPELDSEKLGKALSPGADLDRIQDNLSRLSCAKMEKLATQSVEDQPEFQLLAQVKEQLEVVLDNHDYVKDNYHKHMTIGKINALADSGNTAVINALDESRVYKMGSLQAAFSGDSVRNLGIDKENIKVSVDSEQATKFNLSSVASQLDSQKLASNMPIFEREAKAYMQNAIA